MGIEKLLESPYLQTSNHGHPLSLLLTTYRSALAQEVLEAIESRRPTGVVSVAGLVGRESIVRDHDFGFGAFLSQYDGHDRLDARVPIRSIPSPCKRKPIRWLDFFERASHGISSAVREMKPQSVGSPDSQIVLEYFGPDVRTRREPANESLRIGKSVKDNLPGRAESPADEDP